MFSFPTSSIFQRASLGMHFLLKFSSSIILFAFLTKIEAMQMAKKKCFEGKIQLVLTIKLEAAFLIQTQNVRSTRFLIFIKCNASCQPKCGSSYYNSTMLECGCMHGCVCEPGMIRSETTKKCITMEKCRQIIFESKNLNLCGKNEHFSDVNSGCQSSCYTLKNIKSCPPASGCVCVKGFVRDYSFGDCIPVTKCPSNV